MSIGSLLKSARESAGLSVDEVAALTRIRAQIIRDLEAGDLSSSGGIAYARGHVRSIAKVIGTDPEVLVAQFNAEAEESNRSMSSLLAENSATPIDGPAPKLSYKKLSYAGIGLVALLIIIPFITSLFSSTSSPKKPKPAAVASSVASPTPTKSAPLATQSAAPSTTPTPLPTASASAVPTPAQSQISTGVTSGQITFTAKGGNSWFSVTDSSGTVLWHGTLFSGASQSFSAASLINVTIGNAGVVDVAINGKDAGISGRIGQVVNVQYGPGAK